MIFLPVSTIHCKFVYQSVVPNNLLCLTRVLVPGVVFLESIILPLCLAFADYNKIIEITFTLLDFGRWPWEKCLIESKIGSSVGTSPAFDQSLTYNISPTCEI